MRRSRLFCVSLLCLSACIGGCSFFGEPTVASPYDGKPATAGQIAAQQQAKTAEAQAVAAKEAAALASAQREAADRLAAEDRQRMVDFRAKVASLEGNAREEVDRLTAQYNADALTTTASLERLASGATAAAAELAARTAASVAGIKAQGEAALAAIQAKQDQVAGIFGVAQTVGGAVPGYGPLIAGGIGLVGALFGVHKLGGAQKAAELQPQIAAAADKGFDEGHAAATAAAAQRDQHYDLGAAAAQTASLLPAILSMAGVKIPPVPAPVEAIVTGVLAGLTPPAGTSVSNGQGSPAAPLGTIGAA